MEQCNYCSNKEKCFKNHWAITFDNGYKIKGLNEYKCDNFKLEKGCSITCIKECDKNIK